VTRPSSQNAVAPVAVIGAGPVGAVAALALAGRGIPVCLFESRERAAGKPDGRAIALSWGTRIALEQLGVWRRLARVDPITRVSVSERGAFGSIEFSAADLGTPALGHVVDYEDLALACADALDAAAIDVWYGASVTAIDRGPATADGHAQRVSFPALAVSHTGAPTLTVPTGGVILADGAEGVDADINLRRRERIYRQVALVGEVGCDRFRRGWAFERFTGSGPLALLPRSDRYACVWVVEPAQARALLEGGAGACNIALQRAAGPGFGEMQWLTAPREVALSLRRTEARAGQLVVPVGNASQTLHPVAGQGFNLGVRDALALAAAWPRAAAGHTAALQGEILAADDSAPVRLRVALDRYRRDRRPDRGFTVAVTDLIARVTAVDHPLAAALRGLGLSAIDLLPPVRRRALETLVFGVS